MAEPTVDAYLAARPAQVREVLVTLRALVRDVLAESVEEMKYGAPVYWNKRGEEVVYLYGGKDHANLGFLRGAQLEDPLGLLQGTGKSGRHVKVFPGRAIDEPALRALLRQCA